MNNYKPTFASPCISSLTASRKAVNVKCIQLFSNRMETKLFCSS